MHLLFISTCIYFIFFTLQAKFLLFNKAIITDLNAQKKKPGTIKKKSEQLSLTIITVARCQQSDIQQYSEKNYEVQYMRCVLNCNKFVTICLVLLALLDALQS